MPSDHSWFFFSSNRERLRAVVHNRRTVIRHPLDHDDNNQNANNTPDTHHNPYNRGRHHRNTRTCLWCSLSRFEHAWKGPSGLNYALNGRWIQIALRDKKTLLSYFDLPPAIVNIASWQHSLLLLASFTCPCLVFVFVSLVCLFICLWICPYILIFLSFYSLIMVSNKKVFLSSLCKIKEMPALIFEINFLMNEMSSPLVFT